MHALEIARLGLLSVFVTIATVVGVAYVQRPPAQTVVVLQAPPAVLQQPTPQVQPVQFRCRNYCSWRVDTRARCCH